MFAAWTSVQHCAFALVGRPRTFPPAPLRKSQGIPRLCILVLSALSKAHDHRWGLEHGLTGTGLLAHFSLPQWTSSVSPVLQILPQSIIHLKNISRYLNSSTWGSNSRHSFGLRNLVSKLAHLHPSYGQWSSLYCLHIFSLGNIFLEFLETP